MFEKLGQKLPELGAQVIRLFEKLQGKSATTDLNTSQNICPAEQFTSFLENLIPGEEQSLARHNKAVITLACGILSPITYECSLKPKTDGQYLRFPWHSDSRYTDRDITGAEVAYTPLWLSYDSETGEISSPSTMDADGEFSWVLVRFTDNEFDSVKRSYTTRNYSIDPHDPGAKYFAEIFTGIAKSVGAEGTVGGIDTGGLFKNVHTLLPRRIHHLEEKDLVEIADYFGALRINCLPGKIDSFLARPGDAILLDSITLFNGLAHKIEEFAQSARDQSQHF